MISFWTCRALLLLGLALIYFPSTGALPCNGDKTEDLFRKKKVLRCQIKDEMPYQISVQNENLEHLCTGAIIASHFAITVARCVDTRCLDEIRAVACTVDLIGHCFTNITAIYIPDNYNPQEPCNNDIALLKLAEDLIGIGGFVFLPSLSDLQNNVEDHFATVSGFDLIPETDPSKNWYNVRQLYKVNSHIISHPKCNSIYRRLIQHVLVQCSIPDTQICTFDWQIYNQTIIEDMGALLVYNRTLVGITSCARQECSYPGLPNVFTNVAVYVSWIEKIMYSHVPPYCHGKRGSSDDYPVVY